jgi:hypothetical protein
MYPKRTSAIRNILASTALLLAGCSSAIPNRNVVGEAFPPVKGKSLGGVEVELPKQFENRKVILVLGYVQETQFDIDRWSIGFFTAPFAFPPVVEVPTIPGLIPSMFSGKIDEGMRRGIPKASWSDVVTVYGTDGSKIAEWTGTEQPRNARIVLIDETGIVRWMYDGGFGIPPLKELLQLLQIDPKKSSIETKQ